MSMTLAEAMAMAVLKGDLVAAYALADKLQEQRDRPETLLEMAAAVGENHGFPRAYEVASWPEFRAFCDRLGILCDLHTTSLTIRMGVDEPIRVEQEYIATDMGRRDVS